MVGIIDAQLVKMFYAKLISSSIQVHLGEVVRIMLHAHWLSETISLQFADRSGIGGINIHAPRQAIAVCFTQ